MIPQNPAVDGPGSSLGTSRRFDEEAPVEELRAELRRQLRVLEQDRKALEAERAAMQRTTRTTRQQIRNDAIALRDLIVSMTEELDEIVSRTHKPS